MPPVASSPAHSRASTTPPTPPLQRVRSMSRTKVNIDEMVGALALTSSISLLPPHFGDVSGSPGRGNVSNGSTARSVADAKFENRVQEAHRLTLLHHALRQLADLPFAEAQVRQTMEATEGKTRNALMMRMQRCHNHVVAALRAAAPVKRPLSQTTVDRYDRHTISRALPVGGVVSPPNRPLLSVSTTTPRAQLKPSTEIVNTPTSLFRQLNDSSSYSKTSYESSPVSPIPVGRQYRRSLMGTDAMSPAASQESFMVLMGGR